MLIPLRDVIPSRLRPWGTLALIALMSVVFLADQVLALRTGLALHAGWWWVPVLLSGTPSWVTFIANSVALWIFGENVEGRMGHARFLLFFAGGAVTGALTPQLLGRLPLDPLMGASAAVGAVVAAYAVLYPTSRVLVLAWLITAVDALEVPAFFFVGLWVLAQFFWAMSLFTDATATLLTCAGGVVWGLVMVWVLRRPMKWRPGSRV